MIEIDHRHLNPETLKNLLTEIVLREGTEYGEMQFSTEEKKIQLINALQAGKAVIVFDVVNNYCDVIPKR